jgi:hypothetical protein
VRADDPNVARVELVAQALGDLCDTLVFVGGCAAGLLCTSPKAPPPRITYDVDVIAEVAALAGYHALERQFAKRASSATSRRRHRSAAGASANWKST